MALYDQPIEARGGAEVLRMGEVEHHLHEALMHLASAEATAQVYGFERTEVIDSMTKLMMAKLLQLSVTPPTPEAVSIMPQITVESTNGIIASEHVTETDELPATGVTDANSSQDDIQTKNDDVTHPELGASGEDSDVKLELNEDKPKGSIAVIEGLEIKLSPGETKVLEILLSRDGKAISASELAGLMNRSASAFLRSITNKARNAGFGLDLGHIFLKDGDRNYAQWSLNPDIAISIRDDAQQAKSSDEPNSDKADPAYVDQSHEATAKEEAHSADKKWDIDYQKLTDYLSHFGFKPEQNTGMLLTQILINFPDTEFRVKDILNLLPENISRQSLKQSFRQLYDQTAATGLLDNNGKMTAALRYKLNTERAQQLGLIIPSIEHDISGNKFDELVEEKSGDSTPQQAKPEDVPEQDPYTMPTLQFEWDITDRKARRNTFLKITNLDEYNAWVDRTHSIGNLPKIVIIDDSSIEANGMRQRLSEDQQELFNILLANLGKPLTRNQIFELGFNDFTGSGKRLSNFSSAANRLLKLKINKDGDTLATGDTLNANGFALSTAFVIEDQRSDLKKN